MALTFSSNVSYLLPQWPLPPPLMAFTSFLNGSFFLLLLPSLMSLISYFFLTILTFSLTVPSLMALTSFFTILTSSINVSYLFPSAFGNGKLYDSISQETVILSVPKSADFFHQDSFWTVHSHGVMVYPHLSICHYMHMINIFNVYYFNQDSGLTAVIAVYFDIRL